MALRMLIGPLDRALSPHISATVPFQSYLEEEIMAIRHIRGLFAVVAMTLATMAFPHQAESQGPAGTVWTQLEAVYDWADAEGYSTRNYIIGKLDEDEKDTWTMTLYGGNDYLIIGACDGDCGDLDIALLDEYDNTVARDTETDDVPVVELSLKNQGRYQIQVTMYSCSVEPCYFGLGIFYK